MSAALTGFARAAHFVEWAKHEQETAPADLLFLAERKARAEVYWILAFTALFGGAS